MAGPLPQQWHRFNALDYAVVVGYLFSIAIIGILFYRRKTNTRDYFLGGRAMGWLPVGISIIAADTSAITVMGVSGWGYGNNLEMIWSYLGYIISAPVVIFVFIPFFTSLNLYTGYQYLERRFGLPVRLLASLQFQFLRSVHVAIALYAPSIALSLVTGLPIGRCICLMGVVTTVYTSSGGMKAVIWTDVIQFTTISVGLAAVWIAAMHGIQGGMAVWWRTAASEGRLHCLNLSTDPSQTTSVWASLIGGSLLALAWLTTDQALLQRMFTTKSRKDCVQSVILNAIISFPMMAMLALIGTALFVFFRQHPAALSGLTSDDAVLPFFAIGQLPHVLSGLVIAAIFAASMAVMSAGINSLSTATTIDFYKRLIRRGAAEQHYATFGRIATVVWGCTATVVALFMDRLGKLAFAYTKVSSFVSGPLLGVFLLGLLTTRATGAGALIGAAAGTVAVTIVSSLTNWSFFYEMPIGVGVTLLVGFTCSFLTPPPRHSQIAGLVLGQSALSTAD